MINVEVTGTGRWDRKSGQAKETLQFSGTSTGTRVATGVCNQDPWLKDAPGGAASCLNMKIAAKVEKGPASQELLKPEVFLLARMVSLPEAQALSAQHAAASTAQPPPPKPNVPVAHMGDQPAAGGAVIGTSPQGKPAVPVRSPPGNPPAGPVSAIGPQPRVIPAGPAKVLVEAEELANAGKYQTNSGKVAPQSMKPFGPGWGGNSQLLWSGGAVGAVLDLNVDIPEAGNYAVDLYFTRAPDYANLQVEVNGKPSAVPLNGFSTKVAPAGPVKVGTFALQPGVRQVSFMIVGHAPKSTGYLVGIDRIVLSKVAPR
jgi:uncharacterized Zn-binding protein involved in type VI secretion